MQHLKNDRPVSNPPIFMSGFVSKIVKDAMTTLPFAHFFKTNPILVPIPKSSLMKPGTLWVPLRLANALVQNGLGIAVEECLRRDVPLRKAATSLPKNRPKPAEHYNSLGIQRMLSEPKEILLVDDVVTRGATIVGAANKLYDVFPGVHIRAFAVIRTISSPRILSAVYDPCKGEITLRGEDSFREP
jgi:predicted amidophosphoribosyltransferase